MTKVFEAVGLKMLHIKLVVKLHYKINTLQLNHINLSHDFHSQSAAHNCLRHRFTDAPDPEGFHILGVETLINYGVYQGF